MYTHYRGTTFQFIGQFQDDGVNQDLTGATLTCEVFDALGQTLIATLVVNVLDASKGLVTVSYPNTSTWPVGKARLDSKILFQTGQLIASDPEYFRIAQTPVVG